MKKEFNFKGAKRVGDRFKDKDVKVSVTARLDPKVVNWLRQESERKGIPYQTLMNSLLTEAMNSGSQEVIIRRIVREELQKTG
ncbi:MAG: BrnA antitoxin family protein [Bdellovibrionota bacterium]